MPKRKRGADLLSLRHLDKLQEDISRSLKEAKGYERQRMSKRQREPGVTPQKKEKLGREIVVLKSLDLHQTARAHLYSSLLKIKSIASHENLPEPLKKGVAKPELAEDERVVLHNVTSGLYNHDAVKQAVDKAIAFVCGALNVPVPEKGKKGERKRKSKTEDQENSKTAPGRTEAKAATTNDADGAEDEDETDFEGFSSDEDDDAVPPPEDMNSDAEVAQENDFASMDGLLGSSSDEDENEERARLWEKYRGKETVNLDDISVSGGDSDPEADDKDEDEDDNSDPEDEAPAKPKRTTARNISLSPSPEPPRKKPKRAATTGRPTDSTFLPSLMGGYVSGSESASDVDVAPPKKRRGQRARQAIWEQKYGRNANHIKNAAATKSKGDGSRDSGWDMKRGAVDGSDDRRTPWKKGVRNPFSLSSSSNTGGDGHSQRQEAKRPPTKRDDEGPLHPSWEARKKAKESRSAAAFAGSKVVFN